MRDEISIARHLRLATRISLAPVVSAAAGRATAKTTTAVRSSTD
jgi:hypothetical protein